MKLINWMLAIILTMALSAGAFAQKHEESVTKSIKVAGNCGSCKSRIEKAATLEGVSKAVWDPDTKVLKVTFNPSKVTLDAIQKSISAAGHDTEKYAASDQAYQELPGCCQYERMTPAPK